MNKAFFFFFFQRTPGLAGVAKAIKIYQDAIRDKIDPKKAFKSTEWLTKLE